MDAPGSMLPLYGFDLTVSTRSERVASPSHRLLTVAAPTSRSVCHATTRLAAPFATVTFAQYPVPQSLSRLMDASTPMLVVPPVAGTPPAASVPPAPGAPAMSAVVPPAAGA